MSDHVGSQALFKRVRAMGPSLFIAALALVTGLTASAWAWLAPSSEAEPTAPATRGEAVTPPARRLPVQDRVEAETITLNSGGFEPAEIRRPAGRVLIALDKLPDVDQATVRLESESGQVLHEVTLERRRQKWRKVIELAAGAYALTVSGHPEWRCQIFIY